MSYDSETERFLSEDTYRGTKEDPLSLHLYAYCAGNPLRYSDPSGHFLLTLICIGVATGVASGVAGGIAGKTVRFYFPINGYFYIDIYK